MEGKGAHRGIVCGDITSDQPDNYCLTRCVMLCRLPTYNIACTQSGVVADMLHPACLLASHAHFSYIP